MGGDDAKKSGENAQPLAITRVRPSQKNRFARLDESDSIQKKMKRPGTTYKKLCAIALEFV